MYSLCIDNPNTTTPFSKHTKILINYSLFIHLGDLYRYKSQFLTTANTTPSYIESESCYKQAIALDPSNGKGHHQLAILSSYQNAMCMCIYRYCRALACQSSASNTLRNVKVELSNNSKKLQASRTNPPSSFDKKYLTNVRIRSSRLMISYSLWNSFRFRNI